MVEELNNYLNKLVEDNVFPGCNYGIVTYDETFYGCVGYKSIEPKKEDNKLNNIYDVASLTKVIVINTIMGVLIDEKKIDMQDYVTKYFEDFKFKDVMIIHLLCHSSGLVGKYDKNNIKNKEELYLDLDQEFKEGTNTKYSDVNYILLGFIIEKVLNDKLDSVAKKMIFDVLDMKNSCYNPTISDKIVPTLETGIVHDPKAKYLNGVAGHAGLFSNVEDITHFIHMILHNGYYNSKQLLNLNILDLWFRPLFIDDNNLRKTVGWTYGKSSFICNKVCGDETIYHSGYTGCFMLIDRSNDLGIVLLSNRVHPNEDNNRFQDYKEEIISKIYELLGKYDKIL